MSKYSESEDEPDIYQSSGSEWDSSDQDTKRKKNRRVSTRSKKPKYKTDTSSESEEEVEEVKPRKKNGVNKKQKVNNTSSRKSSPPAPVKNHNSSSNSAKNLNSKDYSTGSFLILKKDAKVGDPNKPPCIWRVDGKALLQKYEPFEEDDKTRHRTTSVYTGWSALDRDLYAPVIVTVSHHGNQQLIVDLNWEKLKEIDMDSD